MQGNPPPRESAISVRVRNNELVERVEWPTPAELQSDDLYPIDVGHHVFVWRIDRGTQPGPVYIRNNVFYEAPYGAAFYAVIHPEDLRHFVLDGNTYWQTTGELLKRALARCREKGIGAGVSIRMNDTHGTPWPDDPRHSDFWRSHPEWRIAIPYRPSGDYATVYPMDCRQSEVRDYVLALLREVVTDYTPDALELDFMRFPGYFPPGEGPKTARS